MSCAAGINGGLEILKPKPPIPKLRKAAYLSSLSVVTLLTRQAGILAQLSAAVSNHDKTEPRLYRGAVINLQTHG